MLDFLVVALREGYPECFFSFFRPTPRHCNEPIKPSYRTASLRAERGNLILAEHLLNRPVGRHLLNCPIGR